MRVRTRTTVSLALFATTLAGCPFNNPYEYVGQACSADKPCDAPGLECVDGTCQGTTCSADSDCAAPFDACVDGRCQLPGASDAAARDRSGSDSVPADRVGQDSSAADSAATDAAGADTTSVDGGAPDTAGSDTVLVGDAGGTDLAAATDIGAQDVAGSDTLATDAATSDTALGQDSSGGWDAAGTRTCITAAECPAGSSCLGGYCRSPLCDSEEDCAPTGLVCVLVNTTTASSGLCAPATCTTPTECGHPLLVCGPGGTCEPRRGQPYQACTPGASWCEDGLDCVVPYSGGLGTCQPRCSVTQSCPAGFLCVGMGPDATLSTDGSGVCLATCGAYAVATPLVVDPVLTCSIPGSAGTPPGLLLSIPEDYVGMTCNGPQDCGGPFVCVSVGSGSFCMLTPEALLWQAAGDASIVPGDANGDTTPDTCGGGLHAVIGTGGVVRCLPRCLDNDDCRFAVPPSAIPACEHPTGWPATTPGFCSVAGPFSWRGADSCFRPDLVSSGATCMLANGINDSDGDGFNSGIDQCDSVAGGMGGCNDWPCRVNEECGSGRYCVVGRCVSPSQACRLTCAADETPLGTFFCTTPNLLCARDVKDPAAFCVNDTDCTMAMCDGGSAGCVCIANTCVPRVDAPSCPTPYLDGCVPPAFVNGTFVSCADTMDCPAGALCEEGDGRCYFPSGDPPTCESTSDCPSGWSCAAGYCWETGCPEFAGGACLDCELVNGPSARWTLPMDAVAGQCFCGMTLSSDGSRCLGKRVLCPGGDDASCPAGLVCLAGRCVASLDAGTQACPPWHTPLAGPGPTQEVCASCLDAAAGPVSWDLPCYGSGDPACPCDLLCLPDTDGNGRCVEAPRGAECMRGLVDGDPCQGGGVWFDGQCRKPRGCASDADCEGSWRCATVANGPGFCAPETTINCPNPGEACGAQWQGSCANFSGMNSFCVPNGIIPTGAALAACGTAPSLCGPTCACMHDGAAMVATELKPRECGTDAFGIGDVCMPLSMINPTSGLLDGQPCTVGGLPGRGFKLQSDTGFKCIPTGALPSPGCSRFSGCTAVQTCQLGVCYGACPGGNCPSEAQCSPIVGSAVAMCTVAPTTLGASCSSTSPYCARTAGTPPRSIGHGGVCLPSAAGDTCFPRQGCDLASAGDACVDGAVVDPLVLADRAQCAPLSRSPCALGQGTCGAGLCHPADERVAVCGASAACGHWLECGMGELCVGGRCRAYSAQAGLGDLGGQCDGRPYGVAATAGVIWSMDAAAGSARCLRTDDPRCGGRVPGQTCDQVQDPRNGGQLPPLVCSTRQACVEVDALPICSPLGAACNAPAGWTGTCASTLRGVRCVP